MRSVTVSLAILFTLLSDGYGENLFNRKEWSFSKTEQEYLQTLNSSDFQELLSSSLNSTGNYRIDDLRESLTYNKIGNTKIIDLNNDNISELVLKVDVSGRGVFCDTTVLSRSVDGFIISLVPDYGPEINLWSTGEETALVGSVPVQSDIARADPQVAFPSLYAWDTSGCRDVSSSYPMYYETVFMSNLNAFTEHHSTLLVDDLSEEEKNRLTVEAKGWALSLEKVLKIHPDILQKKESTKGDREINVESVIFTNVAHKNLKNEIEINPISTNIETRHSNKSVTSKSKKQVIVIPLLVILIALIGIFFLKNSKK